MPKIMLDAGHGQSDPGAVGPTRLKEKDAALALTRRIGKLLDEQGVEVSYTRTDDNRLVDSSSAKDLRARADKANKEQVDYFVSIHHNSAAAPAAHGAETYVVAKGGRAEQLAKRVQAKLTSATGLTDRGVKTANLAMLRETDMPAVLVEVGFISNPGEEALLRSEDFLDTAAEAIAKAVTEQLGLPWQEAAEDWQTEAIKRVSRLYGLDTALWLAKKDQPATVGEVFGILNKIVR